MSQTLSRSFSFFSSGRKWLTSLLLHHRGKRERGGGNRNRQTETVKDRKKERNGRKETDGYFPHSVCSGNVMCDCLTQAPNLCSTSPNEKRQIEGERFAYKSWLQRKKHPHLIPYILYTNHRNESYDIDALCCLAGWWWAQSFTSLCVVKNTNQNHIFSTRKKNSVSLFPLHQHEFGLTVWFTHPTVTSRRACTFHGHATRWQGEDVAAELSFLCCCFDSVKWKHLLQENGATTDVPISMAT